MTDKNARYADLISFVSEIECEFPYLDESQANEVISRARSISSQALFFVLHEICRPPKGANIPEHLLLRLAEQCRIRLEHPLATIVFDSACAIINDELLTESEVVDRLNQIAVFPNQHAALSIVYFSHDGDGSIVEELYDEILQGWD